MHAVLRVDLAVLADNLRVVRQALGTTAVSAVVKANAYGHGAPRIAPWLEARGVRHFCVATLAEALALRADGLQGDLLVLGAPVPGELVAYRQHGLEAAVATPEVATAVLHLADTQPGLRVQVLVDTGMQRYGLTPEAAIEIGHRLLAHPGVRVAGFFSHLAQADHADAPANDRQRARFAPVVEAFQHAGCGFHLDASAAALQHGHAQAYTVARIGGGLFGHYDFAGEAPLVQPASALCAPVRQVRPVAAGSAVSYGGTWRAPTDRHIAVVGAGYADGYPRRLSNNGWVGYAGHRLPVVGRVCMDALMIDLGPASEAVPLDVGAEVTLWGGPQGPTIQEVAAWADTIPYEIWCRVGARVRRCYEEDQGA
ncbi:MAG: alanine racemase [Bacteroidota bacterium]